MADRRRRTRNTRVIALGAAMLASTAFTAVALAGEFPPIIALSSLDGVNGFRLDGHKRHNLSGGSVAAAGDINGNGFSDLVIGTSAADPGGRNGAGESYVAFGKAGGFTPAIALSSLDGSMGFRLLGIDADDRSGWSVASAGDVNGDGFDDVIIGAPGSDPGGRNSAGESYVMSGKAGGFASAIAISSLCGKTGVRLDGSDAHDSSGFSVAGAGGVNGDGSADFELSLAGFTTLARFDSGDFVK